MTRDERAEARLNSNPNWIWANKAHDLYNNSFTPEQQAELLKWEYDNADGNNITAHDWPGWEPLIGKCPNFKYQSKPKRVNKRVATYA